MTNDQERRECFRQLCVDTFGEVPATAGPWHTSGEEDAAEILYGDEPLARYVLVTYGGEHGYLYPADTLAGVADRLRASCGDYTYGEGPGYLADLDTLGDDGEALRTYPVWETLRFLPLGATAPDLSEADVEALVDALTEAREHLEDKVDAERGMGTYDDDDLHAIGVKIETWTRLAERLR